MLETSGRARGGARSIDLDEGALTEDGAGAPRRAMPPHEARADRATAAWATRRRQEATRATRAAERRRAFTFAASPRATTTLSSDDRRRRRRRQHGGGGGTTANERRARTVVRMKWAARHCLPREREQYGNKSQNGTALSAAIGEACTTSKTPRRPHGQTLNDGPPQQIGDCLVGVRRAQRGEPVGAVESYLLAASCALARTTQHTHRRGRHREADRSGKTTVR